MSAIARLFLSIDKITGDSVDNGFKGKIELDSWDWSLERKANQVDQKVKPEPSVFRFTKPMDKSSTQLLNKLKSGDPFMATVTLIEESDSPFELSAYLVNARIITYSVSGKDEDKKAGIDETWTINYDKIHFEHTFETNKTSKTIPSSSLWRPAHANTDRPDTIKGVVDSFRALKPKDQIDAASEIRKEFPDAMKGQLPADQKGSSSSEKVKEVVSAFRKLNESEQKKAGEQIDKLR